MVSNRWTFGDLKQPAPVSWICFRPSYVNCSIVMGSCQCFATPNVNHMTTKGKERESETPEVELTEAEKKKRSFERSLAGPSVGKAGLIRDQTGEAQTRCELSRRGEQNHRRGVKGMEQSPSSTDIRVASFTIIKCARMQN
jgi:hypothetical protein